MDKKVDIGNSVMNTLLGKGSRFNGNMKIEGGVRIDGEFEGQIEASGTLVIGKEGFVKAEVKAKDAIIGGRVIGNLNIINKIELQSGSYVQGDIKSRGLIIDNDVFFEGKASMGEKETHK